MLFTEAEIQETNEATLKGVAARIDRLLIECTEKQKEKFKSTYSNGLILEDLNGALALVDGFLEINAKLRNRGKY
ncbi:MAG: hypothetical protein J7501_13670 [Bdellovibrio sp.]|nr:hypothetical protein [Bdellovibrio sp.]